MSIWTDGACSGNPGPGGWGAVLRYGEREKELNGGEPLTTNNRMELTAAIAALEALTRPCAVEPAHRLAVSARRRHRLARKLEAQRLAHRGQEAGEERGSVAPPRRSGVAPRHRLAWVRGHAGDPLNERADELAREGMSPFRK